MPREIGWSNEANLLYQIKQLLKKIQGSISYISKGISVITNDVSVPVTLGEYLPPIDLQNISNSVALTFNSIYPTLGKVYPDASRTYQAYNFIPVSGNINIGSTTISYTNYTFNGIEAIYRSGGSLAFNIVGTTDKQFYFPDLLFMELNQGNASPGSLSFIGNLGFVSVLSFPKLVYAYANIIIPSSIAEFNLPKLEVIHGSLTVNSSVITSFSVPELLYINSFSDSSSNLSSFSFPKLKVINNTFNISGTKTALTSITFPSLEHVAGTFTMPTTSTSLTTFAFGSSLKLFNSNFVTTSNSLDQASVDNILITLAALDGTNGTIAYSSKTVTITGGAATPSAAGLAAKAVLIGRGCTVTTN